MPVYIILFGVFMVVAGGIAFFFGVHGILQDPYGVTDGGKASAGLAFIGFVSVIVGGIMSAAAAIGGAFYSNLKKPPKGKIAEETRSVEAFECPRCNMISSEVTSTGLCINCGFQTGL